MDNVAVHHVKPRRFVPRTSCRTPRGYSFGTTHIRFRGGKHRFTVRKGAGFLEVQGNELRQAKTNLQRLYAQEQNAAAAQMLGVPSDMHMIRTRRQTAERRYVNCLIKYMRDANRMNRDTAVQLQHQFTRQKMAGLSIINQQFLFSMYPYELN